MLLRGRQGVSPVVDFSNYVEVVLEVQQCCEGPTDEVLIVSEHDRDGGAVHCESSLSCAVVDSNDRGTETRRRNSCSVVVSVLS